MIFGLGGSGFKKPFVLWNTRSRFRFSTQAGSALGLVTYFSR
jgi:hypothetical protein